jgi:hypothetical protein
MSLWMLLFGPHQTLLLNVYFTLTQYLIYVGFLYFYLREQLLYKDYALREKIQQNSFVSFMYALCILNVVLSLSVLTVWEYYSKNLYTSVKGVIKWQN